MVDDPVGTIPPGLLGSPGRRFVYEHGAGAQEIDWEKGNLQVLEWKLEDDEAALKVAKDVLASDVAFVSSEYAAGRLVMVETLERIDLRQKLIERQGFTLWNERKLIDGLKARAQAQASKGRQPEGIED
jgi:hypothetical protein